MLLLGLLLLTSALTGQRTGTRAESNLSSKLQLSSDKEQNDWKSAVVTFNKNADWPRAMGIILKQKKNSYNEMFKNPINVVFENPYKYLSQYSYQQSMQGHFVAQWLTFATVKVNSICRLSSFRMLCELTNDHHRTSELVFTLVPGC
ncbi:hypothetical protein STEG23_020223 [Scotinomys teguina]